MGELGPYQDTVCWRSCHVTHVNFQIWTKQLKSDIDDFYHQVCFVLVLYPPLYFLCWPVMTNNTRTQVQKILRWLCVDRRGLAWLTTITTATKEVDNFPAASSTENICNGSFQQTSTEQSQRRSRKASKYYYWEGSEGPAHNRRILPCSVFELYRLFSRQKC